MLCNGEEQHCIFQRTIKLRGPAASFLADVLYAKRDLIDLQNDDLPQGLQWVVRPDSSWGRLTIVSRDMRNDGSGSKTQTHAASSGIGQLQEGHGETGRPTNSHVRGSTMGYSQDPRAANGSQDDISQAPQSKRPRPRRADPLRQELGPPMVRKTVKQRKSNFLKKIRSTC